MIAWLERWLGLAGSSGQRIGVSKTWTFSWPDAGADKCGKCGIERRKHDGQDHQFVEEKSK